ncbi:hypothetical protein DESC_370029 [Desulfosarcina cetonica]|nr:hypothetical protein DESC_370029 [Desulfosarcina cetonica]
MPGQLQQPCSLHDCQEPEQKAQQTGSYAGQFEPQRGFPGDSGGRRGRRYVELKVEMFFLMFLIKTKVKSHERQFQDRIQAKQWGAACQSQRGF